MSGLVATPRVYNICRNVCFQSYMDSEIQAIMAQYMPLDSQNEVPNHANEDRA